MKLQPSICYSADYSCLWRPHAESAGRRRRSASITVFCIRLPGNSVIDCGCVLDAAVVVCCVSMSTRTLRYCRRPTRNWRRSRFGPRVPGRIMEKFLSNVRVVAVATFTDPNADGMSASLLVLRWHGVLPAAIDFLCFQINRMRTIAEQRFSRSYQYFFVDIRNQLLVKAIENVVHHPR